MRIEERIDRIKNFYIAYHRTKKENMEHIIDEGFRPGCGDMYGKGFYLTYDLASQTRSGMTIYGDGILKCKINPKNLLILDYNVSTDVFGDEYSLKDQLIKHYKIYRDILDIPRDLYDWSDELEKTFQQPTFSADLAYNQFVKHYIKNGICSIAGIRGIIFSGNHDGNVLVLYSHETAIPYEFAITDPSTGELVTEWMPVKSIDKVMNRANLADFAIDKFKGMVTRIEIDNYDITRIEKDFRWLFQAVMKDASFKIHDNGTLEWLSGTWKKGHWYGDIWNQGTFESGVWHKGEFLSGTWEYGNFLDGTFAGHWYDGVWKGGIWKPQATWAKGEIVANNRASIVSSEDPITFFSNRKNESTIYHSKELLESFDFRSLSDEEKEELFTTFETSYKQATGASWNQTTFNSKASNWLFFGSSTGGIAVRRQNSGMYKLNATYGNFREIIAAYYEMDKEIGNQPIWGVMTLDLAKMLEKLSKKEFKMPPKMFAKMVIPHIAHIFGDTISGFTNDGGIIVDSPAGKMTKYLIGNRKYFSNLLDNATNHPEKVPVPASVLKGLIAMVKLLI
jgi:hypothetical protein